METRLQRIAGRSKFCSDIKANLQWWHEAWCSQARAIAARSHVQVLVTLSTTFKRAWIKVNQHLNILNQKFMHVHSGSSSSCWHMFFCACLYARLPDVGKPAALQMSCRLHDFHAKHMSQHVTYLDTAVLWTGFSRVPASNSCGVSFSPRLVTWGCPKKLQYLQ